MTTKLAAFKTSVNIKFDLGKKEFVNRYLPTPSHAESLIGLLKGFNDPKNNKRSHIIVGPYGTGKSLIATIVGNLTSKKIKDQKTLNTLSKKFNKVHDDIYVELQNVQNLKKIYYPVVLNGYEGRFREALINAILRTINENEIDILLPGQYGKIIETIDLWESQFPKTFKEFKKLLRENNKDLNIWRLEIMNQDRQEVDWFLSIYPQLTSGARFTAEYNESFIDEIRHILFELNKQNIGLFIAYDEFGRLLQTLELQEINETMQDLQDLAELVDHENENLHLLLITHRNLRHYFTILSDDLKNEFQRIEKRFKVYYVESDKSTFIRLADNIIQGIKKDNIPNKNRVEIIKHYLRKYPLFPELNQQEIDKIIIEGIYPVHPVSLYLLPYLSSIFGQNERTLFTFLESNETGGLLNHLNKTDKYYLPSDLFNYFFPNIFDLDTGNEEQNILRIYKALITKTPQIEEKEDYLNIIRFITLWQLAGLQSKIKLDSDFLCFALNTKTEKISSLLKDLSQLKVIRFHRVHGYWELFEGSSFQIEQLIAERLAQNTLSRSKQIALLENCLPKHHFFSNEYNDQKSMTRYASVKFLLSSEIIKNDIMWQEIKDETKADAVIYYVLNEDPSNTQQIINKIKNNKHQLSMFCISRLPFSAIEESLTHYSIIDLLLGDTELLNEDKNLKQELLLRKEDSRFIIDEFLSKYVSYGKDVMWVYNGDIIEIKSEIMLENKLSSIMFKIFPDTPEVRNDSFNRRRLNNVQKKAGQIVLDHLINNYHQEGLGIEGQGPDYLIYATIFKNNKLDPNRLNNIESKEFGKLRSRLINHIEQNSMGTLDEFVNLMIKPPFGIRESLIPIYLVTLLRDKWDQIMFYRNDLFVSGINGEKLYKMFDEASDYNYVYYNFDEKYQLFFKKLETYFGDYQNELVKNKPIVIRLNNALLSWLRSLPRITQITNHQDEELIWIKDTIRRSEINPQESLTLLYEKYGNDIQPLLLHKQELENYFVKYRVKLEKEIYVICKSENFVELNKWAEDQSPKLKKENNLVKSILNSTDIDEWLLSFVNNYIGINLENWSDTTLELFKNQLNSDFNSTLEVSKHDENYIEISYNGKVKAINKVSLSTKSETIYKNVERMIRNAGRNVTKEEIENLVIKLVDEFIE
ncbi:hypothetical protein M3226_30775 [Neobacillus cucumis]|uniref:hypothetical protein n=1 Tax=Neobacillus cucumis TaxID=1740721 RepID=UPI00203CE021|nr:hypothetical protein [Neobacillus cucumis]MCM3729910.1 hypothetical protein [Neobacillus cucumis]